MEKTFQDSLIEFIREESKRRGWFESDGSIDEHRVFEIVKALGDCTSMLARELSEKNER